MPFRNYQFNQVTNRIVKELIKSRINTSADLASFKRKVSKKYKIPCPSNVELLRAYHKFLKIKRLQPTRHPSLKRIEVLLRTRPIRSLSGIVNISVLTKPYPCPTGCLFCPLEVGMPKSYLSGEPAAERAKNLKFNPFFQVKKRVEMLKNQGHPTNKIELRIVGGTFSFYPNEYRKWFVKRCFDGANGISKKNLKKAQRKNEKERNKIVGISIETRPDFINEREIKFLRELGVTLVEMGVQNVFNDILEKNKTGLTNEKIALATKLLKDAGFKVMYHLMPNLIGSDLKKDFQSFKIVFSDQKFKPDWIKIYPLMVVKEAPIYQLWKRGEYQSYSDKELIELLIEIKKIVPKWIRVTRILRDIPATKIVSGCKISNLGEVIKNEMERRKIFCQCIRCREVRENYDPKEKIYLFREDYLASDGKEIFLSFENKKREKLYSFLKLRVPSQILKNERHFIPLLDNSSIIREIQTYGELVPFGEKKLAPQHRGLGKKLIKEAEKITKKEFGLKKMAVISAVGTRNYFRKLGYKLKDTYMVKNL